MMKRIGKAILICVLVLSLVCPALAEGNEDDWFTFFLMCNEGMNNDGGNVGNTMMIVSANPGDGRIKLLMFTWDSFIDYPGYDLPQLIDQPFRVAGPEETMKVFNDNFDLDIQSYLSVNYLNLASLIDAYGGVNVDITRAERNAINGMVSEKANLLQTKYSGSILATLALDIAVDKVYLADFGYDIHLNGLQAVAFGWLQYDSVYNCCNREVMVISELFSTVAAAANEKAVFYNSAYSVPEINDSRRLIDLNNMSDEDYAFVHQFVRPIFDKSYHNVSDDDVMRISMAIISTAYEARRNGINLFDRVEVKILPLEALEPYETIAGKEGHRIDKAANEAAIKEFLYGEN